MRLSKPLTVPLGLGSLAVLTAFTNPQLVEDTGTRQSLRLLDMPEPWIVGLVILPLLALVAWLAYWRDPLGTKARAFLSLLRFAVLAILCLVLFRPVLVQKREEIKQPRVILLADDSASMRRRDSYTGDESIRQKLTPFAAAAGLGETSRVELARQALSKELLPRLEKEGYGLTSLRFAESTSSISGLGELEGRGHATHLGDALSAALSAARDRHVTDIVVVSDGRSNGGIPPLEMGRAAAAAGIPVHAIVVGDTRPEKNVIVELVEAPASALEGDEIAVTVRVHARGLGAGATTQVLLEELDSENDDRPRVVAEENVQLAEGGVRSVLIAPESDTGLQNGERRFRVSAVPVEGETLLDDNEFELTVQLTPEKVRVLYVDGYPRWEYRYLKNLLLRSDENLSVQCYLLSATADFLQESSGDLPPLRAVPTSRSELLENYDVVVLGDVNPFAISPDPARCQDFLDSLREFVERGGGLISIAGEWDNPRSFVGTSLEELLPVVLDSSGALTFEGDRKREMRPVIEDPLQPHQIVRLHPDGEINRRLLEEEGGLRGFYWYFPVVRAKPGSRVLLRHPTDGDSHGRYPLLTAGYFPSGRTLFLGFDETWRWRYRFGDRYHQRFWRNAIRWVALGRLKSGDRRIRLDSLRSTYDLDERVTLEARVLDEDYRPSERPTQEAQFSGPDGTTSDLELALVPERPGLYRVSFEVERTGPYRAWMRAGDKRGAACEWEVSLPSRENADPSPDPATLEALASMTGGRAVTLAAVSDLRSEFPGDEERREPISSRLEDAWDNWATLLLALSLLTVEWILRKRWELI